MAMPETLRICTDPDRRDLAWQIGLDAEVTDIGRRRREIRNFLQYLGEMPRKR